MIRGVDALCGPVAVAAAVLSLGGLAKLVRPIPTAGALRALHLPGPLLGVRSLGLGELIVGVVAVLTGASPLLAVVGSMYLAFAIFVVAAKRAGTDIQSCGCFGTIDTPPSVVHVAVNLLFAAVTLTAAVVGVPPLATVLGDQPAAGVPFVMLGAVTVYLVYLAIAVLPLAGVPGRVGVGISGGAAS